MKSLIAILETLTSEEKQDFLRYLKRKNRRTDVKNAKLFKLIAAGKTEHLDVALYGKSSRNAFHALCKRLQDTLIDFVAGKSFAGETSEEMELLKLLLASRIFFEKKQYKVAFKTLEKAEKMALPLEMYSILNEIYHTKIQYAHLNPKWALDQIITASERNMDRYQQDFRLNRAYAVIKSRLHSSPGVSVQAVIRDTFSHFKIELNEALTYKSLFQLLELMATAAKWQNDFYSISPFVLELYTIVKKKSKMKGKHRFYHLSILNLLAVAEFRNKRFRSSMEFTTEMELELVSGNANDLKRFGEKLVTLKALNYNYTGNAREALKVLGEFKGHSLNIALLTAMCLFQQDQFPEAYRIIRNLHHSDTFYEKKMGWIWVVKKNLMEILLLTEMDKLDLVLSRLTSFKRRFSGFLQTRGEERVLTFVNLISRYYANPKQVKTPKFKDEVEHSFEWIGTDQEDIFVMSFYAWLKAKMEGAGLYGITLKLVGQ